MNGESGRALAAAREEDVAHLAVMAQKANMSLGREEVEVLRRIIQQRRRISHRRSQREERDALYRGRHDEHGHHLIGQVGHSLGISPLYGAARDFAFEHPVSVGFSLGVAMALGPNKVLRTVLWALPLLKNSWRVADRTGLLRALRR